MLKYIALIALALPVCVFADNINNALNLEPQCRTGSNQQVISAYDQYNRMLTNYIQKKDLESLGHLKTSFINFVAVYNETCVGGNLPRNANSTFMIDLIEFAIKDDKYTKFTQSNGVMCVEATKTEIQKCVHDHVGKTKSKPTANNVARSNDTHGEIDPGENVASGASGNGAHDVNGSADIASGANGNGVNGSTNIASIANGNGTHGTTQGHDANVSQKQYKIGSFVKKANLKFDDLTCAKTEDLRKCVANVMKTHNPICSPEHAKFIDSLFEFSLNKMCLTSREHLIRNGATSFVFNYVVISIPLLGAMLFK